MCTHSLHECPLCVSLFKVLVEFDTEPWENRRWIKIVDEFHLFFVEKTLVLVHFITELQGQETPGSSNLVPALVR